ncbi:hypothetical protein F3Y30_09450 [Sinorhizobium sp. BG8]|nr:hypothetical protein F3Y30_09450 [Sinorhizobium sp. BG8]
MVTHGTFVLVDDADKTVYVTRDGELMYVTTEWKNLSAVLEANARAAAEFSKTQKLGDMERVASIPLGVYHQWANEGIMDDDKALARRLNDVDFSKFRTNSLKV